MKKRYRWIMMFALCAALMLVMHPASTPAKAKKETAQQVEEAQKKCSKATKKFIDKHTKAKDSKAEKFRKCFNWLNANQGFRYKSWDASEFEGKAWPYKMAYKMLHDKQGQCHEFACSIASIAKELGYKPYVIVTTSDHSFVQIGKKYYDNMGSRFGASSPYLKKYKVYKKVKF